MRSAGGAGVVLAGLLLASVAEGASGRAALADVELATVDLSPVYPWSPDKDGDRAYAPELETERAGVVWTREVPLEEGVIDLAAALGGPTNVVVYARVVLEADSPARLHLSMGSDDGLTVVANGRRVFSNNRMRGLKPDEDQADVELVKGRNELLFRVTQGGGGFGLQVAASAPASAGVRQVHEEPAGKASFTFTLGSEALTSAGIYDGGGRLVRVLWNMRRFGAGAHRGAWDGLDEFGASCPPGEYRFRVAANRARWRNVGAIGNSGYPSCAADHVPTAMHDVAVDSAGAVYTANYWDEAGADFKKWDRDGRPVYDGRYQMRNGQPNGAPYAIAVDDRFIYCTMEGWDNEQWRNAQQVQRFALADGAHVKFTGVERPDGHIQVYEWPVRLVPKDAPREEAELMRWPLRSIAVRGEELLVADTLGGRVLRFHKETGRPQGEFRVKLPTALAVDRNGSIWVGHERSRVSVFSGEGRLVRTVLSALGEVKALAFGPDGRLYVADTGAEQVLVYDVSRRTPRRVGTLGEKARPGDRAADRFFDLRGVAVDREGNVVTVQNEPAGGARLARWSPEGKLLWEHFGTVFVSLANYGAHDPDTLYSMHFHRYRLLDRSKGTWEYLGNAFPGEGLGYHRDVHGVPRILKLGGNEFVFYPTGDGVQVYRVAGGALRLAALLGGCCPTPEGDWQRDGSKTGKWTWSSPRAEGGLPRPEEIRWHKRPGEQGAIYAVFGMDVDRDAGIWFGELHSKAIWTIPMRELNAAGNPVYDWADAKVFAPRDESPLRFEPNMAQRAEDGTVYAFGWSAKWPQPQGNPFWMGGTTLARFAPDGRRLWAVRLPTICVGLDVIPGPGGGCMAGSGSTASVYQYTADGLLIAKMRPGEAMCKESGWLDNHASVAVNRDPRDGLLDVFVEDDYVLRIGWYRTDDRLVENIAGTLRLP